MVEEDCWEIGSMHSKIDDARRLRREIAIHPYATRRQGALQYLTVWEREALIMSLPLVGNLATDKTRLDVRYACTELRIAVSRVHVVLSVRFRLIPADVSPLAPR